METETETEKQMTLKEFIEKYQLKLISTGIPCRTDSTSFEGYHFNVTLTSSLDSKAMVAFEYSTGFGNQKKHVSGRITAPTPKLEEVLDSLRINLTIDYNDVDEWLDNFGHEPSLDSYRVYQACVESTRKLKHFFQQFSTQSHSLKVLRELQECEGL